MTEREDVLAIVVQTQPKNVALANGELLRQRFPRREIVVKRRPYSHHTFLVRNRVACCRYNCSGSTNYTASFTSMRWRRKIPQRRTMRLRQIIETLPSLLWSQPWLDGPKDAIS